MLLVGYLQNFGQVIKYKDVLLEGPVKELQTQLESKYSSDIQYQDKNGMMLKGTYLSYPVLYIIHFNESLDVKIVDVKFKQCYNWTSLEENFNLIKQKLINQYGKPVYEVYNFKNEHSPYTNYERAVRNDCLYSAEFKSNQNGHYIRAFIKGFSDGTASVVIRHTKGEWSKRNLGTIMNDLDTQSGLTATKEAEKAAARVATDKVTGVSARGTSTRMYGAGGYGTFDLNGRSLEIGGLPVPVYDALDEGRVVVTVVVNPSGRVVSTSINKRTNTVNPQLRRAAEEAARKARFNTVDGINNQSGTITYYFKLK